jgi:hypothetical protein
MTLSFMGRLGFEPRTNRLKAECSTAELATLSLIFAQRLIILAQLFDKCKHYFQKNVALR